MTSKSRWLILGLAIAGLAFAGASAWVHYKLRVDPSYISPCDLSATFNCSTVYQSQYGHLAGIPVALGGMFWFALVALLAGFSRPAATREEAAASATGGYLFVLSTIGLASILYLGYASFFVLKTACVLCIGTYVAVIGIFVVSGLTGSVAMTQLPVRLWRDLRSWASRPALIAVAMLYFAGAASLVAFFPKENAYAAAPQQAVAPDMQKAFEDAWVLQPRVDMKIPAGTAKVVVVKYNDWLCGGCKAYHHAYQPVFDKFEKSHPGAIKYVTKDWPWNTKCNFNTKETFGGHDGSCAAAAAVRMAKDRGKEAAMIDWLFGNLERLITLSEPKVLEAIKAQADTLLGVKDFDREYEAKIVEVRRDVADGGALNVDVTPTYFVNGIRCIDGNRRSLPPEFFELAINIELKKAGK